MTKKNIRNQEQNRFVARNPQTRQYEVVDALLGEFAEGETILKQFKFNNGGWITIPGDCIYKMHCGQWVNAD